MKYIWLTIKHKYFVFRAGLRTKAPIWNLIVHDWSKFLLWRAYNNAFFGDKSMDKEFAEAWLYHQNHEKHHWEYWIPRTSHNKVDPTMEIVEPIEMPERFVREMVADWMGAGRAYEGQYPDPNDWKWFQANKQRIWKNVHPNTRKMILQVIDELK
jgi:hypothetical protein